MASAPELTHEIALERLGKTPEHIRITADADSLAGLKRRFGLLGLDHLTADLRVRRRADTGWISVAGTLEADAVQECVVSLDPVPVHVEAEIEELFDDRATEGEDSGIEVDIDPLSDLPEPLEGPILDLGEVVAQAFGLALDPYPRASDAAPPDWEGSGDGLGDDDATADQQTGGKTQRPFADLQALRDRLAAGTDPESGTDTTSKESGKGVKKS